MLFFTRHESAVFLFHRVLPVRDAMWDPIDPQLFERSIAYINKNFFTISLDEVIANKTTHSSKPLAAITFDDGYRDFIDYALPVLNKYAVTASMFIVSDCIENNIPTWTYIFDQLFYNTHKMQIDGLDTNTLPAGFQTKWEHKNDRMEFGKKLKQHIKYIPSDRRNVIINKIKENFNDVTIPSNLMMSWQEIKDIHHQGIQIGAHSVSHPTLDTIASEVEVYFELNESRVSIKYNTDINADIFSYPNGSYNEKVIEQTKKAGYRAALAVHKRPYNYLKDDKYAISRIELYNEPWIKTKASLNGMTSFAKKILRP